MRILINPNFLKRLKKIKDNLRPFEVVEIEKALKTIIKEPEQGERLGKTGFYKRIFEIEYCFYIIVYEYRKKGDLIIFASIE